MRRRVVCDASALVAHLLDDGPDGSWAAAELHGADLLAPSLLAFEAANVVRRLAVLGVVGGDAAAQAHAEMLELHVEWWPYEVLAARAWELRANLTTYDASYVACAELADATLITLDRGIANAPGPRCVIATPPEGD